MPDAFRRGFFCSGGLACPFSTWGGMCLSRLRSAGWARHLRSRIWQGDLGAGVIRGGRRPDSVPCHAHLSRNLPAIRPPCSIRQVLRAGIRFRTTRLSCSRTADSNPCARQASSGRIRDLPPACALRGSASRLSLSVGIRAARTRVRPPGPMVAGTGYHQRFCQQDMPGNLLCTRFCHEGQIRDESV